MTEPPVHDHKPPEAFGEDEKHAWRGGYYVASNGGKREPVYDSAGQWLGGNPYERPPEVVSAWFAGYDAAKADA